MPEKRQLLFKRAARVDHAGEPPALQLGAIEAKRIARVGKIEARFEQVIHLAVIDLLMIDEVIDRALAPARGEVIDVVSVAAKPGAAKQVRRLVKCESCHKLPSVR